VPRFSWSTLPSPLVRALARDLDLDVLDVPNALRRTFGVSPREEFVRGAWTVLRDVWLANDDNARRAVIERLTVAALGDLSALGESREAELAYLSTCRNTPSLRHAVLNVLIDTGRGVLPSMPVRRKRADDTAPAEVPTEEPVPPAAGLPEQRGAPEPAMPVDQAEALEDRVEGAWAQFAAKLAGVLAGFEKDQTVVLALDPDARSHASLERSYFVALTAGEEGRLTAEAVGNDALPADIRLHRETIERLIELGWDPPHSGEQTSFTRSLGEGEQEPAARLAIATLREAYGAPHPAFLRYEAHGTGGARVELPRLGLRHVSDDAPWENGDRPAPAPSEPELLERVRRVVADVMDLELDSLTVEEKNGIPVRAGTAMVYVRVRGESLIIEVFSPMLLEVARTPQLLEKLNDINMRSSLVKTFLANEIVYGTVQLTGSDFDPAHLEHALRLMTSFAEDMDEKLQGDFGGRPFFGEALPGRTPPSTGYYL
jgi:hypothetical protein